MEVQPPHSATVSKYTEIWTDRTTATKLVFVNTLTIVHALLLLPSVVWLVRGAYMEALVCAIIAAQLDWMDGFFARKWNVVTDFGKFADPIADKIYFLGMLIVLYAHIHIAVIAVICALEVSLVVHRIWILARKRRADVSANIFGKLKAVLQNIVICVLLLGLFVERYDMRWSIIIIQYISLPLLYCTVPWATLSLVGHIRKHI